MKPTSVTRLGVRKLVPVITRLGTPVPTGVLDTDRLVRFELLVDALEGMRLMTGGTVWPLLSVDSTCWPVLQAGVA